VGHDSEFYRCIDNFHYGLLLYENGRYKFFYGKMDTQVY